MLNDGIILFDIQRIWPHDLSRTREKAETIILLNTLPNMPSELDNEWFVQAGCSLQRFINSQIATIAIAVMTKRVGEIPLVSCPETLSQYFKWWTIRTYFPSCWIPQEKLHSHLPTSCPHSLRTIPGPELRWPHTIYYRVVYSNKINWG